MATAKKLPLEQGSRTREWANKTRQLKSLRTSRRPSLPSEALKIISKRTALSEDFFRDLLDAGQLSPETQALFSAVVKLKTQGRVAPQRMARITTGLAEAIYELGATEDDPLASVDDASQESIALAVAKSQHDTRLLRERILEECISSAEATELVNRVRQSIDRRHREGGLVALRVKNQWQYPIWQFDPDKSGGVVEGLGQVLKHLDMSELGKILWLTEPNKKLGGKSAIELLREGNARPVIDLAEESSYLP